MSLNLDYSSLITVSAIPEASSMIETFRAIGYSIESAVADIVDNSISAGAQKVWITFEWKGSETWLSIMDDGHGMDNDELIQAMRPGSKNPLEERHQNDLGRFGLGLKTASFSQCRKLTVISKKVNSTPVFWTWDLDFVKQTGNWNLINWIPNEILNNDLTLVNSGTSIIWNEIDRLGNDLRTDDSNGLNRFLVIMEQIKKHLSMVFHRFLENKRISIYFQDRLIDPWDPFLINEMTTQSFPEEFLGLSEICIKGYVLPHKSKLSEDKFRIAEGPKGWNEQQGFYVYRGERLLLSGDWLGLFRKEEHYKLARIKIDLTNKYDSEWQIDIKKSVARPPVIFKEQLKAYAFKVRQQAVEVYRHRGKNITPSHLGQKFVPLWVDHKRGDKWFYKINKEHPIFKEIRNIAIDDPDKAIDLLIRFIEETIPVKSIYIKEVEESESQGKPFEGISHNNILELLEKIFNSLINQGKSKEEAKAFIANLEPFNHYPEYFEGIQ